MRRQLQKQEGERKKFQAIFVKLGTKAGYHGYSQETVLLKHIIDTETKTIITDHVWFSYTKGFQIPGLVEGSPIEFEARIKIYTKGYVNPRYKIDQRTTDYKLSHPTKIRLIKV